MRPYKPVDNDDENNGWVIAAGVLGILFALALLLLGIIIAIRVAFTIDSTNCGGSANTCLQPYKDYLGNCVDGRFKINGASCTNTCGAPEGTCIAGQCTGGECNGICLGGNSTFCPDLIAYSPLFGEYAINKTCELGDVCTYNAIHDSWIEDTAGPLDYIWNDGNMVMLKNKCADLLLNSTFTPKTCLTVDVYFVPIGQPLTGNQNSTEPTLLSLIKYQPQCIYTFACATHLYDAGSLSDDTLPTATNADGSKKLLTWKEACQRVNGEDSKICF